MNRQLLQLLLVIAASLCVAACNRDGDVSQLQTPEQRGRALVDSRGCTACHALTSARGIGPGWGGIYGTTRSLQDGRSVVVDDEYLRRAMLEPAADVVAGFDNVMVPAAVDAAQIADIIALIKSLEGSSTP